MTAEANTSPLAAKPPATTPETQPLPGALTLDEIIAKALVANRVLRDARSSLLRARLGRSIATTQVYTPVLTTTGTVTNAEGDGGSSRVALTSRALGFAIEPYVRMSYVRNGAIDPVTGTQEDGYTRVAGVSISRQLFAIAAHIAERLPITQADADIYSAANRLVLRGRELELEATRSFFAVQRAQVSIEVRKRRLSDAQDFLANEQDRIEHGFASPLDGLNAEVTLNQAQSDLISDRTNLATALETLNRLLDRPVSAPTTILPHVIDDQRIAAIPTPDVEQDVTQVLTRHETLGIAARDAELLALRLRVQRDRLMPDVQAAVGAERALQGDTPTSSDRGDSNALSLTVTWRLPLDGWRADRAAYQQLLLDIDNQERQVAEQRAQLESNLRDAGRAIDARRRQVSLAIRRLEIDRLRLESMVRRNQAGAVDNLEVTRAKQDVDNAEISLLDSRIQLIVEDARYRSLLPMTPTPVVVDAPESDQGSAPASAVK